MDALIMSCGTGGGHNAAARAVAEELVNRGNAVTFLDPFSLIGAKAADNVSNAYIRLVQKSPKAFGYLYSLGKAYDNLPIHSPVYWANGKMADHMRLFLEENPFDVVVMSHIYPAHILANMKRSGVAVPETILIATDYTCIPFLEEGDCDYYAIPSPDLKEEFCAQGIPEEKLLPTGSPVRPAFTEIVDKNQARSHLHLSPKKHYILITGGSIGVGKIQQTLTTLEVFLEAHGDWEAIVVCGNNDALYDELLTKYRRNSGIRLIRQTSHMALYMKACDIFITKPGGLSSTEAAVVGIPTIFMPPIPGCETRNLDFFTARNLCIPVDEPELELLPALEKLQDPEFLLDMQAAQRQHINGNATHELCDFIENLTRKEMQYENLPCRN